MAAPAVWVPEFLILWVQKPRLALFTLAALILTAILITGLYMLGSPYLTYDFSPSWANDLNIYRTEDLPRINGTSFVSVGGLALERREERVDFGNLGKVFIPSPVISTSFFVFADGAALFPPTAVGTRKAYSAIDPVLTDIPIQMNTYDVNCTFMVNFTQKSFSSDPVYATDLCFTVTWAFVKQPHPLTGELTTKECFQWFKQTDGCEFPLGDMPLGASTPMNARKVKVYVRVTSDPEVTLARLTHGTRKLTDGVDNRDLGTYLTLVGSLGLFFDLLLFMRDDDRYKRYFQAILENCRNFKRNVKKKFCDPFCPDDAEDLDEEAARELAAKEELERQKRNPKKKHLDYEEFKRQQQDMLANGGANSGRVKNALGDKLLSENMLMPAAPEVKVVVSDMVLKEKAESGGGVGGGANAQKNGFLASGSNSRPNFGEVTASPLPPQNGGYPSASNYLGRGSNNNNHSAAAAATTSISNNRNNNNNVSSTLESALDLL